MRLNRPDLLILFLFLFSCQKNDVAFIAVPFYQRCTISSINVTEEQKTTKIKYNYDQNGKLKFKLYKDLGTGNFIAMDTIMYLPDGLVGRIEYHDIANRALPISTYSSTYANGKISRIFETGFLNNIPYVITFNYEFKSDKIIKIEKTGDLVYSNYTLNNFQFSNSNITGCQFQLENNVNTIDLIFTSDNNENISNHLLPYPNSILFNSTLNNITAIKNVQAFDLNGIYYEENSTLFKQDLFFSEDGALEMAFENKSDLQLFSGGPALKKYNYSCE